MPMRHRPGVLASYVYTGAGGWERNAVTLNEKDSHEEPSNVLEQIYIWLPARQPLK